MSLETHSLPSEMDGTIISEGLILFISENNPAFINYLNEYGKDRVESQPGDEEARREAHDDDHPQINSSSHRSGI